MVKLIIPSGAITFAAILSLVGAALAPRLGTGADGATTLPRITVPGLAREVRVVRDEHAMPAVYASGVGTR